MPYVDKEAQSSLGWRVPETSGELNYVITRTLVEYLEQNGLSYSTINDVLGALDGASKEFYRRIAVPYEDYKRVLNGDVYPPALLSAAHTQGFTPPHEEK